MSNLKYIGKNILNHDLVLKKGDVSGSNASTGSFGNLNISKNASITGDMVVGGTLTAQEIHTEIESASIIFTSGSTLFGNTPDDTHIFTGSLLISGSISAPNLIADSASFSTRITTDSSSFSTRTTTLEAASASFSTRVTTAETELEETIISASAQLAEEISGSFTAPSASFSTRITNFSTGNVELVSGSATSTGSFGRVEVEHIHSTDDISAADDITAGGRLVAETDAKIANIITLDANGISVGNDTRYIRVGSDSDLELNHRHPLHTSPFRASTNTNIITDKTNHGLLLFGGNPGIIMESAVSASEGVFLSGSRANIELRGGNISGSSTSTGSFGLVLQNGSELSTFLGAAGTETLFSGSAVSTGSFGRVEAADNIGIGVSSAHVGAGLTIKGTGASSADHGLRIAGDTGTLIVEGGSESGISVIHGAAGSFWRMMSDGELEFGHRNNFNVGFYTNNTKRMVLNSGGNFSIGNTNNTHKLDVSGTGRFSDTLEVTSGNISGSATSTGSFGRVETSRVNATNATFTNEIRLEDGLSAPAVGDDLHLGNNLATTPKIRFGLSSWGNNIGLESYWTVHSTNANEGFKFKTENGGSDIIFQLNGANQSSQAGGRSANFKGTIAPMSNLGSGLGTTSYRFSELVVNHVSASGNISASSFIGIFNGALSGSAQIASNISGAFAVASASFAADILSNSSSFATRITSDSSSFAARDTLSEATSSKILNGQLEFTNITASNAISASGNLTIGGISVFDSHITASGRVNLDGKVFIQTGSIEGDLHVRTNENLMRIGKSTSGVIVSGSGTVSRFATGSDGSIIDLGFTAVDEDGNVVLAGDGDGIHIDGNNYWYNNKYYKIGDGVDKFLTFDNIDMKYKGQVFASTGSFDGEMFINSPTGSMFIGKFTGGIESSGSGNISRFATGSDGSIIDLGFTTTDESGETVFLSTGDGIVVDSNNYWYTSGHFKIGDANNFINWNTNNLTISGTFSGDGSGLSGLPQSFTNITSSGDALFQSNLTVNGRLTAQELHTEIESASIIFTSGSTIFGNSSDDTHSFTGSLNVNGAITASGEISASKFIGDGSQLTGISSFAGAAGTETLFSGSAVSTGSFGTVESDSITVAPNSANAEVNINSNNISKQSALYLNTDASSTSWYIGAGGRGFSPFENKFFIYNRELIQDAITIDNTNKIGLAGRRSPTYSFDNPGTARTTGTHYFEGYVLQTSATGRLGVAMGNLNTLPSASLHVKWSLDDTATSATLREVEDTDINYYPTVQGILLENTNDAANTGGKVHIRSGGSRAASVFLYGENAGSAGNSRMSLWTENSSTAYERISLESNGDVLFGTTVTKISGSAVSTGSFGIIENNTQIAGFRPIINQTADFSASLSNAGRYHIVHGNLTCSIGTDASMPVTIGAEYEFFQSSSVGKFLFQTGSGVSLLSKNDNKNIAGQHSGATLKKVAANTFHLVGDLT